MGNALTKTVVLCTILLLVSSRDALASLPSLGSLQPMNNNASQSFSCTPTETHLPSTSRLPNETTASPPTYYSWKFIDFPSLPPPRFAFSLAINPINDVAIMFGGLMTTTGETNDTWLTDGIGWIQLQTPHVPPPRANADMVFDTEHQEVVLFGGTDDPVIYGDTWLFDGNDWLEQSPAHSPVPRISPNMAYDPVREEVILFGGYYYLDEDDFVFLNDTWSWDGTDWQQLFPVHMPPPRFDANMVFSNFDQTIILFGGAVGGGLLDDTWSWNGNDWTELQPAHRPPARQAPGMTYDEQRQAIILYGGNVINFRETETWDWAGDDWAQLMTLQVPPENLSYRASLVYLPWRQEVVLLNDHRLKYYDDDGNLIIKDHLEGWVLTNEYVNYFPVMAFEK
jgi:hypothetical protein